MAGETTAEAFLNVAQQYRLAAKTLSPIGTSVESPVYFLYSHALELALKAFMRAHGRRAPRGPSGHDLQGLLKTCEGLGLEVSLGTRNAIGLMQREVQGYGFRYFLFESTSRPEIGYLAEVVDDVLSRAAEEVSTRPSTGRAEAVVKFIVGKPQDQ